MDEDKKNIKKEKYYKLRLLVFSMNLISKLPFKAQLKIGKIISKIAYKLPIKTIKKRKHITLTNLKRCFPEKSDIEINNICKSSFEQIGITALETITSWCMNKKRFAKIPYKLEGFENFEYAKSLNKPILLLGSHFSSMEIAGRLFAQTEKLNCVYQKHKSPFMEDFIKTSRESYTESAVQRKNVLSIVKTLKRGKTVWYAPDQDFGNEKKVSIFVPFFNIPCATLTATSWIVKKTNAIVVPLYSIRNEKKGSYKIYLGKPWEDFPSGNNEQDAIRYNLYLEEKIRSKPNQYLWQHRRFKTRPSGEKPFY